MWTWLALMVPNAWLAITEPMPLSGRVANILLPGGIYLWLLTLGRRRGMNIVLMLPLMFFAAFQIVLLGMYGRSVLAVDMLLNCVTTNSNEVGELLGRLWPSVALVVAIYLPPLLAGAIMWVRSPKSPRRKGRLLKPVIAASTLAGLGCMLWASFATPRAGYSPLNDLYPLNVGRNVQLAVRHTLLLRDYALTSAGFRFNARSVRPADADELYVIVVGETSRADRYGINGAERQTTPRLSARMARPVHGGLTTMPRVLSESNTTHKSVPLMLTHLSADEYADSIYRVRSLITAFREAGFNTAFISNQRYNHSYIDFFASEADTCLFVREATPASMPQGRDLTDLDLLPLLDSFIIPRGKHLIVIHAYGSHFSYADRYAGVMSPIFTPDSYNEASAAERPALLNAYDNTIALTDSLLEGIIEKLEQCPAITALLFTSDHGEDIFDDGRTLFLHASPCPSFRQLHVPFIIWTSEQWRALHPEMTKALAANAGKRSSSSESFFHTALLLGGVDAPGFLTPSRSPLSPVFAPPQPRFLNDHDRSVTLQSAGFTPVDHAAMKSMFGR